MRIGIDFRFLSCGSALVHRGMGRFTQQQLREVLHLEAPHEYVLLLLPGYDAELLLPEIAAAPNVARAELPATLAGFGENQAPDDLLRDAAVLGGLIEQLGLDLYHAATPLLPADPEMRRLDSRALVATHYDLVPLVYPEHYLADEPSPAGPPRAAGARRERYRRAVRELRQADRLLAISAFGRGELHRHLGIDLERIDVATPVAEPWFVPLSSGEAAARLADLRRRCPLPDEFLLAVTHLHHAKNLLTLLRAFALLPAAWRRRHPLALAGDFNLAGQNQVGDWARSLGIENDLVMTGLVADPELVALYNAAHLVVHPSRYEGFGLPVLEAMRCGAVVIAGDATALPEVLGEAGILVDAEDPAAFASAIERLDGDPGRRRELRRAALARAALFTPRQLGEATLRCYERAAIEAHEANAPSAARSRAAATPAPRPRLAVWSPLPPQQTGIADYTAELLGDLAEWADIEIFVDDGPLPLAEILDTWPVFHHLAFERRQQWHPYDLVIYQLGAAMYHLYILEAARRWPGLLVLHDLALGYVSFDVFAGGFSPPEVRRHLLDNEGAAALADYEALTRLDPELHTAATEAFLRRHLMLRGLIAGSRGQIVHLPLAKAELESLYPQARVFVVPMGVGDPWLSVLTSANDAPAELRRRHGLPPAAFVFGAFGIADPVKRLESAIRALARLHATLPRAYLLVVGPFTDDAYGQRLVELAHELGVGDRLRLCGRVAKGTLDQLLIACDAVVNLRHPFRKQMSATLLRAVAAGRPVAISDLPDWHPIPASFCYRVPAGDDEDEILAAWLYGLAQDPARAAALGQAARNYYLHHATIAQMADRYREICESLIGAPRTPPPSMPAPAASPPPPAAPPELRHNKACSIEDFRDPELAALIRDIFPHLTAGRGAAYPTGSEDRKHWEIAMSVRALRRHGALRPDAQLLGVGAGCELTSFYLTHHAARVVATDLYLAAGGWDEANARMLTRPQDLCPYPFDAWKLTVQHMDGRCLDFPDASFAGVFSSGSIEHFGSLADVAAAAYEVGRVLEPGGIATLSTELLIAGPPGAERAPGGWPGVMLLDPASLRRYIVEASGLEPVDELDTAVSVATLRRGRELLTAVDEIRQGERKLPHLVLSHQGETFGSVHLALRKTARYPAADNAWARPTPALRAEVAAAATAAGARLQELLTGVPAPPAGTATDANAATDTEAAITASNATTATTASNATTATTATAAIAAAEAAFARWDEVRQRGALPMAERGSRPRRALGFLRRSLLRIRNLGVAWDRERDVLRALLDAGAARQRQLDELDRRVAAYAPLAGEMARLGESVMQQQEATAALPELASRQQLLISRQQSLTVRFGALAVRQQGAEQGLLEHARSLLTLERRLPARSAEPSGPAEPAGPEGAAGAVQSPGLDAAALRVLLLDLERQIPALAQSAAVAVSAAGSQEDELRRGAAEHFGPRLATHDDEHRFPNDLWLHFDLGSHGERPILLANAAGRLAQGGHFLLVTTAGSANGADIAPHPHLRLATERHPGAGEAGDTAEGASAGLRVLIWEKV